MLVRLELRVAAVVDLDVFDHAAVFDLAIRRFDKAEFVDPRKARQRRDQTDVRTFRRLDRADAAVVRRVNVADFKSGTFTRKTARSERRKTAFVRDFGQRIRLVHELRKLRRTEELANRGRHRLGVHEVARHRGEHVLLNGHLFLDRAFHAFEADAELIFEQFADGADAAVAEVIDVVLADNARCPSSSEAGS